MKWPKNWKTELTIIGQISNDFLTVKEQKEVEVNKLELYLGTSEKRPSGKHAEKM